MARKTAGLKELLTIPLVTAEGLAGGLLGVMAFGFVQAALNRSPYASMAAPYEEQIRLGIVWAAIGLATGSGLNRLNSAFAGLGSAAVAAIGQTLILAAKRDMPDIAAQMAPALRIGSHLLAGTMVGLLGAAEHPFQHAGLAFLGAIAGLAGDEPLGMLFPGLFQAVRSLTGAPVLRAEVFQSLSLGAFTGLLLGTGAVLYYTPHVGEGELTETFGQTGS